jgi:hypothetical protein
MVRHGKGPDPKANMMYPGGLGRVISDQLFRASYLGNYPNSLLSNLYNIGFVSAESDRSF